MEFSFFTCLLVIALSLVVLLFTFNKWLSEHHCSWKFMIAKWGFALYVKYQRYFGHKTQEVAKAKGISLELELMNDFFLTNFKSNFSNHSLKTAKHLLKETRESRNGFFMFTMPPISKSDSISIETDKICDTKVIWVKNNNKKDNNNNGIIMSFHGGAYVSGSANSCLPYLIPICQNTEMTGLSIEYNLGPEYPLPNAINQSLTIYKYLINEMKINPKKICLIGDSAGASLIILLMQQIAKECPKLMPGCGITISCWDVPSEGESYLKNSDKDALLDQSTGKIWGEMAVGNINNKGELTGKNAQLNDAQYSYLSENASFKGFSPLLLAFSEFECVSDDSLRIVEKCQECNVSVELAMTPQCGLHVLEVLQGYDIPEAKHLLQQESKFILKHTQT